MSTLTRPAAGLVPPPPAGRALPPRARALRPALAGASPLKAPHALAAWRGTIDRTVLAGSGETLSFVLYAPTGPGGDPHTDLAAQQFAERHRPLVVDRIVDTMARDGQASTDQPELRRGYARTLRLSADHPLPSSTGLRRRTVTTASDTTATPAAPGGSPSARHALAALLVGEGTSYAGTAVHQLALPALAVLQLQATPGQIALLAFAAKLPALVVSLPAGVVLDRYAIRAVLLVTDLAAATAVLAIPAAAVLGQLTMPALYAVALTLGILSVLHSAATMAALPRLAGPGLLHQAHARLTAAITVAGTAGAGLGTLLVAAVGPARAILANAASFFVSAWCATRIRVLPVPTARGKRPPMVGEIRDGILHSARHPLLNPLLLALAGTGFGTGLASTYLAYYLLTTAQVGATGLGMIMAASSLGGLTGALLAPRLVHHYGPGVVLSIGLTVYALTHAAPLIAGPGLAWLMALAAAGCVQHAAACAVGTTQRSVQQSVSPPYLGSRTLQTSFCVIAGSETLGALAAGPLASLTSVLTTMLIGLVLLVLASWVLWRSPVGRLAVMPTPVNARTA